MVRVEELRVPEHGCLEVGELSGWSFLVHWFVFEAALSALPALSPLKTVLSPLLDSALR